MEKSTTSENLMLTYGVSSTHLLKAIRSVFVLSDLTHLKVDRRFEENLHIDSAKEMFCGLCRENQIDWIEAIEDLEISESSFKYQDRQIRYSNGRL